MSDNEMTESDDGSTGSAPDTGASENGTTGSPLDRLRADHQEVLARLGAFEKALAGVTDRPTPEQVESLKGFLTFIAHEVWRHFNAEEVALFPLLKDIFPAENAPVVGGPVFVLTEEHGVLRRLVARLNEDVAKWEQGAPGAVDAVRLSGSQTARAFQKHIYKEDNIVFRLADATLTGEDKAALDAAFDRVLAA